MMVDREICGICKGPWPCQCSAAAVPVVLMRSADDDIAEELAHRMGEGRNDPLTLRAYDPDPPLRDETWSGKNGKICGHYGHRYDLDTDKRVVWCRECDTSLDPIFVLSKLVSMLRQKDERLKAAQELEAREAVREAGRKARARVRRHRFAPLYQRKTNTTRCANCEGALEDAVHGREG